VYAFPAAVILATALQKGQTLPETLKRSKLIRDLSVLISLLETATKPDEANHDISLQAAKAISRTLDQILEPMSTSGLAANSISTTVANDAAQQQHVSSDTYDQIGMELSDAALFNDDGLGEFDLAEWAKNIDWPNMGGEWSTF
jgi:hypothetical protein